MELSGAELKVALGGLGLPPSWFAERMNVTMRTVVRWFDGQTVPKKVSKELDTINEVTLEEMRKMISEVDTSDGSKPMVLHTYRTDGEYVGDNWPASWHRALTFRVLEHLRAQGRNVLVEFE